MRRSERHFQDDYTELCFWYRFCLTSMQALEAGYEFDFSNELFDDLFEFCGLNPITVKYDDGLGVVTEAKNGVKFKFYEDVFIYACGEIFDLYNQTQNNLHAMDLIK